MELLMRQDVGLSASSPLSADSTFMDRRSLIADTRLHDLFLRLIGKLCSSQLIPDTGLSLSSAMAGGSPPLNLCGRCQL